MTDDDESDDLGWHVIAGIHLLELMQRCEQGESADLVFAELWANADHFSPEADA